MQDAALCQHVLAVHQTGKAPERTEGEELLDAATLRAYIAKAKQYNPFIPESLSGMPPGCTENMAHYCHGLLCVLLHV